MGSEKHVAGTLTTDDIRARNAVEAIMWHGYSPRSDARYSVERFRLLPAEDRQAVVKFVNSI